MTDGYPTHGDLHELEKTIETAGWTVEDYTFHGGMYDAFTVVVELTPEGSGGPFEPDDIQTEVR